MVDRKAEHWAEWKVVQMVQLTDSLRVGNWVDPLVVWDLLKVESKVEH